MNGSSTSQERAGAGCVAVRVDAVSVAAGDAVLLPSTWLTAHAGEMWCVSGPNGSGKTTLLRTVLGTTTPTAGQCTMFGERIDLTRPHQRRRLAAVVDAIPVARDMTVLEQVTMVAVSWWADGEESVRRTAEVTGALGLDDLLDRFPHQLSSGQLQLFMLALGLVRPADVLLLDEPERHLDSERVDRLADVLASRAASGTAIVAATHEPVLVARADHVLTLA